ncbi:hypothetical protein [Hyphomonas jannaschiana]|uniref:Uncharacterized protein n=1 Tax=Hyphomonas jannaschiana VP2 TaxID=1280952 RepID=A0A059FGL0_9PROT|nr:hypothetical protein [Hyphomonas jannaschiana]KCZ89628.1 hypothetical protein HJA_05232 [Hyphomonas jannaschiana VP2]
MDETGDFFSEAVNVAQDVLADVLVRGGLHLRPGMLPRGVARQCRVRLTFLINYIRQLIFLLAAGMMNTLPPVKPRKRAAPAPLPDGVEDVTASFLAASGPRPWRLALAPPPYTPMPAMPDVPRKPEPEEVPAWRLIDKVIALNAILADPEPYARRMARTLQRWRDAGELSPVSLDVIPGFRAGRLTEIYGRAVSLRLNDVLAVAWNDTG